MDIFCQLNQAAAQGDLHFLVIGGHAVIHHGYARATQDVDILIQKEERDRWLETLSAFGYKLFHDGGTFLQLEASSPDAWDLDLMLVNAETFRKFLAEAETDAIEGVAVSMPNLKHLLALKFHALRHAKSDRVLKDTDDVVNLVRINGVDVKADWFRQLAGKYGSSELYEAIARRCER